jgi:hypothetical protein
VCAWLRLHDAGNEAGERVAAYNLANPETRVPQSDGVSVFSVPLKADHGEGTPGVTARNQRQISNFRFQTARAKIVQRANIFIVLKSVSVVSRVEDFLATEVTETIGWLAALSLTQLRQFSPICANQDL